MVGEVIAEILEVSDGGLFPRQQAVDGKLTRHAGGAASLQKQKPVLV